MRSIVAVGSMFAIVLAADAAHALKPCPPNPCRPGGTFDERACRDAARWVASGTIEVVERIPFEGDGVKLEFGSFDLTVDTWEKGSGPAKVEVATRWCWNDDRLLGGAKRFRIYALDDVGPDADRARILAAVPLDVESAPKPKPSEPRIDDERARRCGCETPGARTNGGTLAMLGVFAFATRRASSARGGRGRR